MNKHRKKLMTSWSFWDRVLLVVGIPAVILYVLLAIEFHWLPFGP